MDKKLLDILVCPICKGALYLHKTDNNAELWCRFDRLAYPVRDGIPIMLELEAREVSTEELETIK
jgi:uncharacterized protein YbaR (Trm112 family)